MKAEELLNYLTDRPCNVCKCHTDNGCSKWSCVFEKKPDEDHEMTNREMIQALFPQIELGEIHNGRHRFFLKGKAISTFDLKAEVKWLDAPYKKVVSE